MIAFGIEIYGGSAELNSKFVKWLATYYLSDNEGN